MNVHNANPARPSRSCQMHPVAATHSLTPGGIGNLFLISCCQTQFGTQFHPFILRSIVGLISDTFADISFLRERNFPPARPSAKLVFQLVLTYNGVWPRDAKACVRMPVAQNWICQYLINELSQASERRDVTPHFYYGISPEDRGVPF